MLNPNKIEEIVEYYGHEHQISKAQEELQELIDALRNPKATVENVCEEIADVTVMIEQLKVIFDCGQRAEEIAELKVERTLKIMKGKCLVRKKDRPQMCGKEFWACKFCEWLRKKRETINR